MEEYWQSPLSYNRKQRLEHSLKHNIIQLYILYVYSHVAPSHTHTLTYAHTNRMCSVHK